MMLLFRRHLKIRGVNTPLHPETDYAALLIPEPARRTDVRIGYARLSTSGQKLGPQLDALTEACCRRVCADRGPGGTTCAPDCRPSAGRFPRTNQPAGMIRASFDRNGVGPVHRGQGQPTQAAMVNGASIRSHAPRTALWASGCK